MNHPRDHESLSYHLFNYQVEEQFSPIHPNQTQVTYYKVSMNIYNYNTLGFAKNVLATLISGAEITNLK